MPRGLDGLEPKLVPCTFAPGAGGLSVWPVRPGNQLDRSLELALDVTNAGASVPIGGGEMAARVGVQDQYCAFETAEAGQPAVVSRECPVCPDGRRLLCHF